MSRIKFLGEEIAAKENELRELKETLDTEKRARTEEEKAKTVELRDSIKELKAELQELLDDEKQEIESRKAAEAEARKAAAAAGGDADQGETKEKRELVKKYSFYKTFQAIGRGQLPDGLEKEVHEDAVQEARGQEYAISGVGVPTWMVYEQRTDVDQANSAIQGTVVGSYTEAIRQNAVYEQVIPQSNIMRGLTSNVNLNRVNKQTLAWATAENSAAADGGANFGKEVLAPVRLTGFVDVSDKLTIQNGEIVTRSLMADLGRETANKIDAALFSTADITNAIPSIAGHSGVLTFTEAATYAAPSSTANGSVYSDVLAAQQKLADGDALQGAVAFVGSSRLMSDLRKYYVKYMHYTLFFLRVLPRP